MNQSDDQSGRGEPIVSSMTVARLNERPGRSPDYRAEADALRNLAYALAINPDDIWPQLADAMLDLCQAGSSGVSVLEPGAVRTLAVAGPLAPHIETITSRDDGPLRAVMAQDSPRLFVEPEHSFPELAGVEPRVHELLVVPWRVDAVPAGALWAARHAPDEQFDAEDLRLLEGLARFASAAWEMKIARESAEQAAGLAETVEQYRAFVDASAAVVFQMSPDGSEIREIRSKGVEDEPARDWLEWYVFPDDRPRVRAAVQEAVRAKQIFLLEYRIHRTDGSIGWILARAVPILDQDGEITGWFGAATDISERREAQEALRESEERFIQFGEASSEVLWIRDAETLRFEYVNPAFGELYGVDPSVLDAGNDLLDWAALIHPEERDRVLADIERVRQGERVTHEFRITRPDDGAVRWLRDTDFPLRDETGRIQRIGGIAQDITERRQAEAALRESEARFRRIFTVDGIGILVFDANGTLIDANDYFLTMTGYSRDLVDSRQLNWQKMTPPEYFDISRQQLRRFDETGRIGPYEKEYLRADGSRVWILFAGAALGDGTLVEYSVDISDLKRTEAALQESERRYLSLFESMDQGVALCEMERNKHGAIVDYRFLDLNPAAESLFSVEHGRTIGRLRSEVLSPDDYSWIPIFQPVVETGESVHVEHFSPSTDRWYDMHVYARGGDRFAVFFEDITETKRVEAALEEHATEAERLQLEAERAALLESVIEGMADAVIVSDERLPGQLVNQSYRELFRLDLDPEFYRRVSEDRAQHYNFRDFDDRPYPRDTWPAARARRGEIVHEGIEGRMTALDGTILELAFTAAPVRDVSGRITGEVVSARDITARRQADAERERLTADLRVLSRKLLEVQEVERRRLARELHDEIGQALTGLNFSLVMAQRENDNEYIERAMAIGQDLLDRVRQLSLDLRPSVLDDMGLVPAVTALLERVRARTGLRVDLRHEGLDRRFTPEIETAAYRTIQEALTNVMRHAGVDAASVQLLGDDGLTIRVSDNGQGFDPDGVRERGLTSGLTGMIERVRLAGGTIQIDSAPGTGTTIIAELPDESPETTSMEAR